MLTIIVTPEPVDSIGKLVYKAALADSHLHGLGFSVRDAIGDLMLAIASTKTIVTITLPPTP